MDCLLSLLSLAPSCTRPMLHEARIPCKASYLGIRDGVCNTVRSVHGCWLVRGDRRWLMTEEGCSEMVEVVME